MTIDLTQDSDDDAPAAAAAADPESSEAEEEEEQETLAQRVKRRGDRKQREHHVGSYQNMETQQALAAEEMARLAEMLEVRDVEGMGSGLFARRDLPKGFSLSYFGRHYPGFSHYLKDYPQDDGAYTMEHRGEFFDATPIEQLGKYVNLRQPQPAAPQPGLHRRRGLAVRDAGAHEKGARWPAALHGLWALVQLRSARFY